jgi:flagellar M-ring protein FliF
MISSIRQQFSSFWNSLSNAQRIGLIALSVVGLVAISLLIGWATTPSYSVLYSGLSEKDAGSIVEALTEENIAYKLQGTGTILVPTDQVYELRLSMARKGMPESGTVGMEIFSENTLGMTEFTQKVNYQRAMEGELERTIGSLEAIESVRVHIVTPEKTLLMGDQSPTTASVTIDVKSGESIDAGQVKAITYLVANSIEGMKPENVVIVDVDGNLLASGDLSGDNLTTQTDTRRAAEVAASYNIQKKVQNILDSALGPNKAVVQASVVLDWTEREKTEQTFDPAATPIVRSSQVLQEAYSTDGSSLGGIPGAASNLPTPVATVASGSGVTNYQRSEETTNYEISQAEVHEITPAGDIKRVSLSVLVDGITDEEQLNAIRSIAAAAAGIDETRGDTLAVESLAFDRSYYEEQEAEMTQSSKIDLYVKIGIGVAGILILAALLWYFQRLMANLRLASSDVWIPVMKQVSDMQLPESPEETQSIAPPLMPTPEEAPAALSAPEPEPEPEPEIESPRLKEVMARVQEKAPSPEDEQMQRTLTRLAEENPASVAEIIQLWLSEDEKQNG